MVFSSNPLSLSVPEPAFESWLRDSGYLELVDQRSSASSDGASIPVPSATAAAISVTAITGGFFLSLFSHLATLLSLLTLNPLAKLAADDFAGQTPSWTHAFVGFCDSYSFPSSPSQARMRVHENVKRYARNYATLLIICFACALCSEDGAMFCYTIAQAGDVKDIISICILLIWKFIQLFLLTNIMVSLFILIWF